MKANIDQWIQEALSGRYPSAAAKAASHRDSHGSNLSVCAEIAAKAAKLGQPKLLALAFAACPESLGVQCARLLGQLSPACALFCLRASPELFATAQVLVDQELRQAELGAERAKRMAAASQLASLSHGDAKPPTSAELGLRERQAGGAGKVGVKADQARVAPALVVVKRPLKIDRVALAMDVARRQAAKAQQRGQER